MQCRVIRPFKRRGELIPAGSILEIPADMLPALAGYVLPATAEPWRPEPRAWLEDGELHVVGVVPSLAAEIVKLTDGDEELRARLLTEHCHTLH